jgi:uncharacterized surface protein with fasciclin (FAS1) repeats
MRRFLNFFLLILIAGGLALSIEGQEPTPETISPAETTDEIMPERTPEASLEATPEVTSTRESLPATPAAPTSTVVVVATGLPTPEARGEPIPIEQQAHYRIAHFAPDVSAVETQVNGDGLARETLAFPEFSAWHTVQADSYPFTIVPTDVEGSTAAIARVAWRLEAGTWKTIVIIGSAESGTLAMHEVEEDYSELMPGTGGLTLLHAIEGDLMINFNRDGVPYVTELTFPGAGQGDVSQLTIHDGAGAHGFQVVESQNPSNILVELRQAEIQENAYTFIALVGTVDDPQAVVEVTDRAEVAIALGLLEEPGTIIEALHADENLTVLADAIDAAGLTEILGGEGPFTVFAPANFALDTVDTSDPEALADILRYHIVAGKVMSRGVISAQSLNTLAGEPVSVRIEGNNIYVNDAQVIALNIPATNGVIHMINGVLTPPSNP